MTIPDEYIKKVRSYALDHYEQDGWDYLVEAIDDSEIRDEFDPERDWTYEQFFAEMKEWMGLLDSRRHTRRDILMDRAEAWDRYARVLEGARHANKTKGENVYKQKMFTVIYEDNSMMKPTLTLMELAHLLLDIAKATPDAEMIKEIKVVE